MKNMATELGIILIGYFTLVPAIQVSMADQSEFVGMQWAVFCSPLWLIGLSLLVGNTYIYTKWIPPGASLLSSSCPWLPSVPYRHLLSSWAYTFSSPSTCPWILALPSCLTQTHPRKWVSQSPHSPSSSCSGAPDPSGNLLLQLSRSGTHTHAYLGPQPLTLLPSCLAQYSLVITR